ncbi:hypothetical protein [Roseobacter sp.]
MLPWIEGHAAKLGIRMRVISASQTCIRFEATGAEEMLQALTLGCSLGPHGVWVETADLTTL